MSTKEIDLLISNEKLEIEIKKVYIESEEIELEYYENILKSNWNYFGGKERFKNIYNLVWKIVPKKIENKMMLEYVMNNIENSLISWLKTTD